MNTNEGSVETIGYSFGSKWKKCRVVVDFDGVIVSDKFSFREAIRRTTDHYFNTILEFGGEPSRLVTEADIQRFKDTGKFNSDWKLTYYVILYYLALVMRELKNRRCLERFLARFSNLKFENAQKFSEEAKQIASFLKNERVGFATLLEGALNGSKEGLFSSSAWLNNEYDGSVESFVRSYCKGREGDGILGLITRLAPFSLDGDDFVKRLFEETYLGSALYEKFYNKRGFFGTRDGLIDREELIPSRQSFEALVSMTGALMIYSERPRQQGLYVLEKLGLSKYFDLDRTIFNEELFRHGVDGGKPNPNGFVRLIKQIQSVGDTILYVGDSVSDAQLVRNVRRLGYDNVFFIGTLANAADRERLLSAYRENEADIVVESLDSLVPIINNTVEWPSYASS